MPTPNTPNTQDMSYGSPVSDPNPSATDPTSRTTGPVATSPPRLTSARALGLALMLAVFFTAAALLGSWPPAWAPAAVAAIVFAMYGLLLRVERTVPPGTDEHRIVADEERVALRVGIVLLLGVACLAVVVAAASFGDSDWRLIGLASLGAFALLAFIGLPFWAAAVSEEKASLREARQRTVERSDRS